MIGYNIYKLLYRAPRNYRWSTGFTLIELIVSIGVFSIILTLAVGAFLVSLDAQRTTIAHRAVASNTRFALEFMSRQMRVAKKASDSSCVPGDTFFKLNSASDIQFINAQGTCVRFYLSSGAVITDLIDPSSVPPVLNDLTDSSSMTVESLQFFLDDTPTTQPRVTIVIGARGKGSELAKAATITIQTTISPRTIDM